MTDPVVEVARKTTQCGVLEEQLWRAREREARRGRHAAMLRGLVIGALKDEAFSAEYAELAERTLRQIDAE